ncbi:MAG: hypothetical protein GWP91_02810 [Rhodobacterales bacterium]|nr:hypothetical protein [Rhodobacterales bacterium]
MSRTLLSLFALLALTGCQETLIYGAGDGVTITLTNDDGTEVSANWPGATRSQYKRTWALVPGPKTDLGFSYWEVPGRIKFAGVDLDQQAALGTDIFEGPSQVNTSVNFECAYDGDSSFVEFFVDTGRDTDRYWVSDPIESEDCDDNSVIDSQQGEVSGTLYRCPIIDEAPDDGGPDPLPGPDCDVPDHSLAFAMSWSFDKPYRYTNTGPY